MSERLRDATRWIENASAAVSDLSDPATVRALLASLDRKRDGQRCAPDTVRLRRTTLRNALDYAVELSLMEANPVERSRLGGTKQCCGKSTVDLWPTRYRQGRSYSLCGEINARLVAFFAVMYATLRPEEAVNLRRQDLAIPATGWGEIRLSPSAPEVGPEWTDSGMARGRNES
jgi:hypothetical protein